MLRKLLIFLTVGLFLASFVLSNASIAKAQSTSTPSQWYNQDFREWFLKVYDDSNPTEIFGERYTAAQVQWILYSIPSVIFSGPKDIMQCAFNPKDLAQCTEAVRKLIASIEASPLYAQNSQNKEKGNFFKDVFLTNRPLSGISYVREKISKFSLTPEANAQTGGFGYGALEPVQELWKNMRDVSYLLFVLITVVYAFMIMFRMKMSPQTAITIQTALPKLILTIVVVTFSYAIAGFMVDLIYVLLGLIAAMFSTMVGSDFVIFWALLAGNNLGLLLLLVVYFFAFLISFVLNFFVLITTSIFNLGLAAILFPIVLIIAVIFALFVVLYAIYKMIKIIISLLRAVANIFISVIFAPFILTGSALGLGGGGIGSWLKGLLGSILAFPVAGILLVMAFIFIYYSFKYSLIEYGLNSYVSDILFAISGLIGIDVPTWMVTGAAWSPPLIGEGWTGLIFLFISFTCISLIPKAVDIAKGLVEGKQADYGSALGQALNEPVAVTQTGINVANVIAEKKGIIGILFPGGKVRIGGTPATPSISTPPPAGPVSIP